MVNENEFPVQIGFEGNYYIPFPILGYLVCSRNLIEAIKKSYLIINKILIHNRTTNVKELLTYLIGKMLTLSF